VLPTGGGMLSRRYGMTLVTVWVARQDRATDSVAPDRGLPACPASRKLLVRVGMYVVASVPDSSEDRAKHSVSKINTADFEAMMALI
jgi:hypothetical protein